MGAPDTVRRKEPAASASSFAGVGDAHRANDGEKVGEEGRTYKRSHRRFPVDAVA